jgi:acylpyruvate hydrolase
MKIIGVGRNYQAHAKELNNAVPTEPILFFKPDTAILRNNQDFYHPTFSNNINYELELVIKISKEGKHIQEKFAPNYYEEIGLGLDFTARDIQEKAKAEGLPWTLAKGFNDSAPISEFFPKSNFNNIQDIHFELKINNETKQLGHTADMMFGVDALIAYISKFITLKKGDLIFTGTPAGVGSIAIGDTLEGFLEGKSVLRCVVK